MNRILFVCLGNICRSPMAHGAFRALLRERELDDRITVDSCGTSAYHQGEPPDPNMIAVADQVGIDLTDLASRPLRTSDFENFDLLVAMDRKNLRDILATQPPGASAEVVSFMDFVPGATSPDVPDPWWAGRIDGFEQVRDLIAAGMEPLLEHVLATEGPGGE